MESVPATGYGPLAGLLVALLVAGCLGDPPAQAATERYPGERVELEPLAVVAGQRNADGNCSYSWLSISGRVAGQSATVFIPFRRNLGAEPRCRSSLATEIETLIRAEIDDGDREAITLCVKDLPEFDDLDLRPGDRRLESVELLVSGWYFRKPVFWSCDTEPGCPPPDSCGLLDEPVAGNPG